MNGIDPITLANLLSKVERNLGESQHNPLTMGALVAIQPRRSALRSLLGATKDKLARW